VAPTPTNIKAALLHPPFETKGKPGSELAVGTVLDLSPEMVTFEVPKKKKAKGTEPIKRWLGKRLEGEVKLVTRSSNFQVLKPCQHPRKAKFSTGENPKLLCKVGYWSPPSISYVCQASKRSAALSKQGARTSKVSQCKFLVEFKKHKSKEACAEDTHLQDLLEALKNAWIDSALDKDNAGKHQDWETAKDAYLAFDQDARHKEQGTDINSFSRNR
jgi:hypothetical protein